jgi:hypothetical protein
MKIQRWKHLRANKVEILRKEDNSIEVKPKGYLGKKNWREINEIMLRNGFEWFSSGSSHTGRMLF